MAEQHDIKYYHHKDPTKSTHTETIGKCTCGWTIEGEFKLVIHTGRIHLEANRVVTVDAVRILGNKHIQKNNLIYLASPHSHTSSSVREDRYQAALNCTSWMIENGFFVFSPIVHSHNLPLMKDQSKISWEFWKEFDRDTISRCDELWVLIIDGWKESKGVKAEIEIAREMGKKVKHIEPMFPINQRFTAPYDYGIFDICLI